jgi:signal transduction histidine kinase
VSGHAPGPGLRARTAHALQTLAYLALAIPLGVLGLLTLLAVLVGTVTCVLLVGLPLLLGGVAAARALARLERRVANELLGTHLPPLGGRASAGGTWRRALGELSDRRLWRILALLGLKPLLAAGMLAIALVPVLGVLELAGHGIASVLGVGEADRAGPFALGAPAGVALLALTFPLAILGIAILGGLRAVLCTVLRALLAARPAANAPVQAVLAERLGDRTLSIAYWLPDRAGYFDEGGRPVALPAVGTQRAWTGIERDGQPVAAIIHDAELDAGPELVQAAAAAADLALDNEHLKADLRARVEELRLSRLRIVEAGDAARRRIERDLHDGAQQQLVSLALDLHRLRGRLEGAEAAELDALEAKLADALAELRELARGIHPSILTASGLEPAVRGLALRAAIPVDCAVEVGERLPAPVEAAAYFLVAEALTNVAKSARATAATVDVRRTASALVVRVTDDGVGGADPSGGSGLAGLQDRLAALDGTLRIESPPGGPTCIEGSIPLAGDAPAAEPAPVFQELGG